MKMKENMGTHHELTNLYEAVFTLLQNREYLLSVMLLSSYLLSFNYAGKCTVSLKSQSVYSDWSLSLAMQKTW